MWALDFSATSQDCSPQMNELSLDDILVISGVFEKLFSILWVLTSSLLISALGVASLLPNLINASALASTTETARLPWIPGFWSSGRLR